MEETDALLKNFTRKTLTAVALAGMLGLTACGGGEKPADQNPTQAQNTSNKPEGFIDKMDGSLGIPSEWNEGAGWTASIDNKDLVSFGDYIGYVDLTKRTVLVVDGKGEKKLTVDPSGELADDAENSIRTVLSDGKQYLVVTQTGTSKEDPSSVKKIGTKSVVKVYDTELKEVWSKTFPHLVSVLNDAIVAKSADDEKTGGIIGVQSGELRQVATPANHVWAGRFDNVDVFAKNLEPNATKGELTNGIWTYEAAVDSALTSQATKPPAPFGKMIIAERASLDGQEKCDVLDPQTGKAVDLGVASGACLTEGFTSPDGNYVYFEGEGGVDDGIVSLEDKQIFSITDEFDFVPTSISNDGVVYGKSSSNAAVFNFKKDTEPKKIQDATEAPIMVSPSGLAVFDGGKFVVKK